MERMEPTAVELGYLANLRQIHESQRELILITVASLAEDERKRRAPKLRLVVNNRGAQ